MMNASYSVSPGGCYSRENRIQCGLLVLWSGLLRSLKSGGSIYKVLWFVNKKAQYGVNMGPYILCLVTIDDLDRGVVIARALVEQKLAACVNIAPEIRSIYFWKGQVCDETERLLIVKTRQSLFPDVQRIVREMHPYEVPEIISFIIQDGLPEYLGWIDEVTREST